MENEYKLRGSFVCNNCRATCKGTCSKELIDIQNGICKDDDLYPRKQLIGCLGPYCDEPCELQKKDTDLTIDQCINLIKYFGYKLNNIIIKTNGK